MPSSAIPEYVVDDCDDHDDYDDYHVDTSVNGEKSEVDGKTESLSTRTARPSSSAQRACSISVNWARQISWSWSSSPSSRPPGRSASSTTSRARMPRRRPVWRHTSTPWFTRPRISRIRSCRASTGTQVDPRALIPSIVDPGVCVSLAATMPFPASTCACRCRSLARWRATASTSAATSWKPPRNTGWRRTSAACCAHTRTQTTAPARSSRRSSASGDSIPSRAQRPSIAF